MENANVLLFDLDGTLLPMNQDEFVKTYFGALAEFMAPYGYAKGELVDAVWTGTKAMVANDGSKTNEERFWEVFCEIYGEKARNDIPLFNTFYEEHFIRAKKATGYNEQARLLVENAKKAGYRVALATNPLFPKTATYQRIAWAGLDPDMFEVITTYETNSYCKPNPKYFAEVAEMLGVSPKGVRMVGNDAVEDLAALRIGMQVFLLEDDLINTRNIDLADYPHGSYDALNKWLGL